MKELFDADFGNEKVLSKLCEKFDPGQPKSFLPDGVNFTDNINFMPFLYAPFTMHYWDHINRKDISCGSLFLILIEVAKKMKAT